MSKIEEFIRKIPKAELHIHLGGSISKPTLQKLMVKYGVSDQYDIDALYDRSDFDNTFRVHPVVGKLLRDHDDFHLAAYEMQREGTEEGVRYREVFWNPTTHLDHAGVSYQAAQDGLLSGLKAAEKDFGIIGRLIPSIARYHPVERSIEMVKEVLAHRCDEAPGIGMDFGETGNPPEKHLTAYELARSEGLRLTAHAGEGDTPPSNIETCLDLLKCERIEHGYKVLEDKKLLKRCEEEGIIFNVIPTNSYLSKKLAGQDWSKVHPIRHMMDNGLKLTISTDDPPLHLTDPTHCLMLMVQQMKASVDDLRGFMINSIEASWAPEVLKSEWRRNWTDEFDEKRLKILG